MEPDALENWESALLGEALLCDLLARILYDEPDRVWLDTIIREEVFVEVPFGAGQAEVEQGLGILRLWTEQNIGGLTDAAFEAIQSDRFYLFFGAGRVLAPVCESIYFDDEHAPQVRAWYARHDLETGRPQHGPDDHLGLELRFLAALAARGVQALAERDEEMFRALLQTQRRFVAEHPLRWAPAWARLVQEHAATLFYRGAALLAHGALLAIAEQLETAA